MGNFQDFHLRYQWNFALIVIIAGILLSFAGAAGSSERSIDIYSKVHPQTAPKASLVRLPGIGNVLADRIIEYRKKQNLETLKQLDNVYGIGPVTIEKISEYTEFE
ncbi:ComEA family DNA-binding protein [Sedimentisphaera salicampi]|uniref:ComEA protein n=1 Tax=Sedimentisphaera salicampi TaxID=1941349 RepID=A0A1W6LJH3_9BACT|nr:helix-hairpin-helix domain-containing protein [Sedimentisphaera salicampi]ARN55905.1 comEA protein [Sedimentisphaera salicampi]OXU16096.1 comEA protein [Sedimentisphaera salicampi]